MSQEEYITRAEFEAYKKEQEQRQTDAMKAINVNVGSADVLEKLDTISQTLEQHTTMLQEISKGLLVYSKAISALQTDVADLPTTEDVEALLIKYLRPSGNGHSTES